MTIAKSLEKNESLTHLDLRNNNISGTYSPICFSIHSLTPSLTDDGAIALANCLTNNSTLVTLDLRWNQISDNGASAFIELISARKVKLSLQITGNNISTDTMSALSKGTHVRNDDTIRRDESIHEQQQPQQVSPVENAAVQKELANLRNQVFILLLTQFLTHVLTYSLSYR